MDFRRRFYLFALILLFLAPACPPHPQEKVWADVCNESLILFTPYCPGHHLAQYIKGQEPKEKCGIHGPISVEICRASELLAGECCREREIREYTPGDEPTEKCGIHIKAAIEVCRSTGLLPNAACPEREVRQYCPDEKPAAVCSLHQRKPIPDDRALIVYGLLGALDDTRWINYDGTAWRLDRAALQAHLTAISDAGANAVRIFAWGVWGPRPFGKASQFQAFILDGDRWDVSRFNNYYFPLARQVIETANVCGLSVLWDWLDQCEIQPGPWRQYSPWCNNVQGGHDFYDAAIWPQVQRYMLRCVDAFAGLDVNWGFNETAWSQFRDFARAVYFPVIKARSLDFKRLRNGAQAMMPGYAGGAYAWDIDIQHWVRSDAETEFGEFNVLSWIREVHGTRDINRPGYLDAFLEAWGNHPIRILFSDDGVWDGDSLCDSVKPGANPIRLLTGPQALAAAIVLQIRPSAQMWHAIVDRALEYQTESSFEGKPIRRLLSFEHCLKNPDVACQAQTFRAISEAYKERFGAYPGNWR